MAHGLELDEALTFRDSGISARYGRNVAEGALGAFLQAVRDGAIARGSYLIVESLDRISRQNVSKAARTIQNIVDEGRLGVDAAVILQVDNDELWPRKANRPLAQGLPPGE